MDPLLRQIGDLLASAQDASPFLDMIEDSASPRKTSARPMSPVLTGELTPQRAGDMHQECADKIRQSLK